MEFRGLGACFPTGWSVRQDGTRLIASRWPLSPGKDAAATVTQVLFCATLHGPGGDVTIASLHLPSPRFGVKFAYQDLVGRGRPGYAEDYVTLRWARAGDSRLVADQIRRPVILAGDFNTIPISPLYRTIWGRGDWSNAFDVLVGGLVTPVKSTGGGRPESITSFLTACGQPTATWGMTWDPTICP